MTTVELSVLGSRDARACVVAARCGGDLALEELPLDSLGPLDAFRGRLQDAAQGGRRPRHGELRRFGRQLHDALLPSSVRDLVAARRRRRDPLNLQLTTNRFEVAGLPWEMLTEPRHSWGPSQLRSLVRIVPCVGRWPPPPRPLSDRLRVLMVYADPQGETPVPWPETRALLEREFGSDSGGPLELSIIEGRRDRLVPALQRRRGIDVLHFICHGRLLRGVGHLLLRGQDGRPAPVSVTWLSNALSGRDVRLVILTACDSSATDPRAPFGVLAQGLVRSGIPAVVAHQLPVALHSVAPFVGALYAELLQSGDVDRAVAEGRVRLAAELSPPDDVFEWGIPTLHRHLEAGRLFEVNGS